MTAVTAKARRPSRAGMWRWGAAFAGPPAVRRSRGNARGRSPVIVMTAGQALQGRRT